MGNSRADYDVAIIGSGFAGIGMAIRLKQEGRRSFVLWEREAEVGGTWYVNHYPGCACDVQSHLYSFSFEPNAQWSRTFSPQREIWDYLNRCVDKYDVRRHIQFQREMTRARYDDARGLWEIEDAQGNRCTARVLVSGMGGLSRPSIPDLPGLSDFQGRRFHSQQWDHDYALDGKRVAVVGTGASAIQFVPEIARQVARLDLYQRTPPWIMPKPDFAVPGVIQRLFGCLPMLQNLFRRWIYWSLEARAAGFTGGVGLMKLLQPLAARYIRKQIKDPVLRDKVTPRYTLGCKRVLLSNNYYPALARDNVEVVTSGIGHFTADGVVDQNGVERKVDAVILGTGFAATEPLPRGALLGRDGLDIVDAWAETGPQAYKGTTVSGFPNLFLLAGPNTGLGHSSMVFMIESQIAYVMDALARMDREGVQAVDLQPQVQRRFNEKLQRKMAGTVWMKGGCNSWYLDAAGRNVTLWPYYTWQFRLATRRFDLENYARIDAGAEAGAALELQENAA